MELYEDLCQREEADGRKSVWGTGGDRGALQKDYGIPSERKEKKGAAAWWKQGQVSADSPPWSGVVGRVNASAS